MLKPVYDQLKDKNIANYVVYADSTDSKLYDGVGTGKKQVEQAALLDAFLKGRLLICTDAENGVFEVAVKVSANKAYTMGTVSTAVAFVEWAAKAAE